MTGDPDMCCWPHDLSWLRDQLAQLTVDQRLLLDDVEQRGGKLVSIRYNEELTAKVACTVEQTATCHVHHYYEWNGEVWRERPELAFRVDNFFLAGSRRR